MELFYDNDHSAVHDRDHKIDRLEQYQQKLRKLRDSIKGVDSNQINLKHINNTLREYKNEYSDVVGYTKPEYQRGSIYDLEPEPLGPRNHVDRVWCRYGKICDTINTMSGSIYRVKREYSEKSLKKIYHRGCFNGIGDMVVLVWIIIAGISISFSNHPSLTHLPITLLLVALGLLASSSILLIAFLMYYWVQEEDGDVIKISISIRKSSMLIRILNVISFFAFVITIISFTTSLGIT